METHASYTIVGLGNPGERYRGTRHNVGRELVAAFARDCAFPAWRDEGAVHVSEGEVGGRAVRLGLPETFMNRSGEALNGLALPIADTAPLTVAHDDLDIPLGSFKISYDHGAGGHHGVESIIEALGTKAFVRFRVGIALVDEAGNPRTPQGEDAVSRFVLAQFTEREREIIEELTPRMLEALHTIITEGRMAAMNKYNGSL